MQDFGRNVFAWASKPDWRRSFLTLCKDLDGLMEPQREAALSCHALARLS